VVHQLLPRRKTQGKARGKKTLGLTAGVKRMKIPVRGGALKNLGRKKKKTNATGAGSLPRLFYAKHPDLMNSHATDGYLLLTGGGHLVKKKKS